MEGSEPGHPRQREQGAWSPHSEKHSLGRPGNFSRALGGLPQGGIPAFDSRILMTLVLLRKSKVKFTSSLRPAISPET